jgi:hypothetical protein
MRRALVIVLAVLACTALATVPVYAQAQTGTYTGYMGASAVAGGGAVTGIASTAAKGTAGAATAGTAITMSINKFLSEEEIDTLFSKESDANSFMSILKSYNCGTVKIASKSFKINAAHSVKSGSKNLIFLLGGTPFNYDAQKTAHSVRGVSVGYIRITVDQAGKGGGVLYQTTGISLQKNGQIKAAAAVASATKINDIHR